MRRSCEDGVGPLDVLTYESEDYINDHLTSMLGAPDVVGDLNELFGVISDTLDDVLGPALNPLPAPIAELKEYAKNLITITKPAQEGVRFDSDDLSAIEFTVTDAGSGVDAVQARFDGAEATHGQVLDMFQLAPGTHAVQVTAADQLGNATDSTRSFELHATSESLLRNIERSCGEGLIDKPGTCTALPTKLRHAVDSRGKIRPMELPPGTPAEVVERARAGPRAPRFDPALGHAVTVHGAGEPVHRLVVIGDSLTQGFQSGAIFNTELAYGATVARELGWDGFRFPRYGGPGGLPVNIEYILRDLERRFGTELAPWELPPALLRARELMDRIEDHWERGPGARPPADAGIVHAQAVFGYDLRDALARNAERSERAIRVPRDDPFDQVVENYRPRAALHVHPRADAAARRMTLLGAARALGAAGGIETLVVILGANNALGAVVDLELAWSGDDFRDLEAKDAYTVWRPAHFAAELAELEAEVSTIDARHVIWATVPHVTIAPLARGVGGKLGPGSRYFPYYTRPWIDDERFDPRQDPHLTGAQARAVDYAIDAYNDGIQATVERARSAGRDWYLLELAGMLDRLAYRRFVVDPSARPDWWTPYPLPPALRALRPPPDSRFLTADGEGGRSAGGWFSLDGVHPTTVGYGLMAQEVIDIMRLAGVEFAGDGLVDFDRLIARDTLIEHPPQNLREGLKTLAWGDQALDWFARIFSSR